MGWRDEIPDSWPEWVEDFLYDRIPDLIQAKSQPWADGDTVVDEWVEEVSEDLNDEVPRNYEDDEDADFWELHVDGLLEAPLRKIARAVDW